MDAVLTIGVEIGLRFALHTLAHAPASFLSSLHFGGATPRSPGRYTNLVGPSKLGPTDYITEHDKQRAHI
jgi:hypothetical protein